MGLPGRLLLSEPSTSKIRVHARFKPNSATPWRCYIRSQPRPRSSSKWQSTIPPVRSRGGGRPWPRGGNPLVGEPDRGTLEVGRQQYLAHAATLKTTSRERAYLDAMGVYYRDYPAGGQLARTRAYETAMERVFNAYPDDAEAAAFYGLAMVEAVDLNNRKYDQQLKAGKVLEALLARPIPIIRADCTT